MVHAVNPMCGEDHDPRVPTEWSTCKNIPRNTVGQSHRVGRTPRPRCFCPWKTAYDGHGRHHPCSRVRVPAANGQAAHTAGLIAHATPADAFTFVRLALVATCSSRRTRAGPPKSGSRDPRASAARRRSPAPSRRTRSRTRGCAPGWPAKLQDGSREPSRCRYP